MRRGVLIVLLWLGRRIIFGLGGLGRGIWDVVVEDWHVVFLAGEEIQRCILAARLERVIFVILRCRLFVFVGRTTAVSATVAHAGLTTEIVGPALGKLSAWNIGPEDLVDGSIIEDDITRRLVDAELEWARRLMIRQ
jgi:hypothetical protein